MMNLDGFSAALDVEVKRWLELRSDGAARLATDLSDEDDTVLRKSLQGEYNSHIRRVDSLWRQFTDDHKRFNGVPT